MTEKPDIIDVEFETVATPKAARREQARAVQPQSKRSDTRDAQLDVFAGAERMNFAPIGEQIAGNKEMSAPVFALVAGLLSFGVFMIAGGYSLFMPKGAEATPAVTSTNPAPAHSAFSIADVQVSHSQRGGRLVLTIRAKIDNGGQQRASVPHVIVSVPGQDGDQRFLVNRGEILEAGERMAFTSHFTVKTTPTGTPTLQFINGT